MPRRKRHYVYCKKGLHLLSQYGGIKRTTKKVFEKNQYVTRFCLKCRRDYQRKYWHTRKERARLKI